MIPNKIAVGRIGQAVQLAGWWKDESCSALSSAIGMPTAFDLVGGKDAVGVLLKSVCLISENVVA